VSETFRYTCPTETDMSVRNDRYMHIPVIIHQYLSDKTAGIQEK
jgi:hypothetical protein